VPVLLAAAAGPSRAQEPYFGYDAFPAPQIDFTRWLFGERTRQVVGGALLLSQRDYGDQTGDTGTRRAIFSASVVEPQRVTQLRASVAITAYDLSGCAQNGAPSAVWARVIGNFFNVGTPTPGSQAGDVVAQARLVRRSDSADPAELLQVEAQLARCTNADCSSFAPMGAVQSLGTATLGSYVRLAVEWDRAARTFLFQRDGDAKVAIAYADDDSHAPGLETKRLDTRTELASCLAGPRTTGALTARFDNVQVNASALP
jgi:hypothetical protein